MTTNEQPTPTAAAMRAAKVIADTRKDMRLSIEAREGMALVIDAATGLSELIGALKLAQRWLANCEPVVDLDGPKPLPVIAAALARLEAPQQPVAQASAAEEDAERSE